MASFIGSIVFIIFSVFLIIAGAVLTVTLVFSFIGIPLIIIGVILLLAGILSLIFGTLGGFLNLIRMPFRRRVHKENGEGGRKGKIIEVEKEEGVYKAKT